MNELGVLKTVYEDDNIEFYHVHTMKTEEQGKWKVGDVLNTENFLRFPSYNPPKRIREDAFEKVRREKFELLPNRKKCLFLSPSLETAKIWNNTLGGEKQLLRIKPLSGKYVFLDEEIYENEEFTDAKMNGDAYDYWSGDEYVDSKKISVLFEGVFKIEEEICF